MNWILSIFSAFIYLVIYGILGENMIMSLWKKLFSSAIYKHIGWFDHQENNANALTEKLTNDAQLVKGAAVEGIGT